MKKTSKSMYMINEIDKEKIIIIIKMKYNDG